MHHLFALLEPKGQERQLVFKYLPPDVELRGIAPKSFRRRNCLKIHRPEQSREDSGFRKPSRPFHKKQDYLISTMACMLKLD